jgi:hypothetical protein
MRKYWEFTQKNVFSELLSLLDRVTHDRIYNHGYLPLSSVQEREFVLLGSRACKLRRASQGTSSLQVLIEYACTSKLSLAYFGRAKKWGPSSLSRGKTSLYVQVCIIGSNKAIIKKIRVLERYFSSEALEIRHGRKTLCIVEY